MMKRLLLTAFALVALVGLSSCAYIPRMSTAQNVTLWDINGYRGTHGVPSLAYNPALQYKADAQALWMANGGCGYASNGHPNICHSDLASDVPVNWTRLEENVGMDCPPDPEGLEHAFEHSPEHEANILGPVTSYAVGAVENNGCLFVAEEFLAS